MPPLVFQKHKNHYNNCSLELNFYLRTKVLPNQEKVGENIIKL